MERTPNPDAFNVVFTSVQLQVRVGPVAHPGKATGPGPPIGARRAGRRLWRKQRGLPARRAAPSSDERTCSSRTAGGVLLPGQRASTPRRLCSHTTCGVNTTQMPLRRHVPKTRPSRVGPHPGLQPLPSWGILPELPECRQDNQVPLTGTGRVQGKTAPLCHD